MGHRKLHMRIYIFIDLEKDTSATTAAALIVQVGHLRIVVLTTSAAHTPKLC